MDRFKALEAAAAFIRKNSSAKDLVAGYGVTYKELYRTIVDMSEQKCSNCSHGNFNPRSKQGNCFNHTVTTSCSSYCSKYQSLSDRDKFIKEYVKSNK